MSKLIDTTSYKIAGLASVFLLAACSNDIEQESSPETAPEAQEEQSASSAEPAPRDLQPESDAAGSDTSDSDHEARHQVLKDYLNSYLHRTQASNIDYCATFAYGYNPCGGPARYVVYSQEGMSDEDIARLQSRAAEFNQIDTFMKSTQQVVGVCVAVEEPEVVLRNGQCRAENRDFQPVRR